MITYTSFRLWAVIVKEFIQMKRDKATLAMIIAVPLLQVILFGYAINADPKHLPTGVLVANQSEFTRTFIQGMQNSGYFTVVKNIVNEYEAEQLLATDQVQFVVNIPPNFTQDLVRGNRPAILVEADATNPTATSNALAAINVLNQTIYQSLLQGSLDYLQPKLPPVELRVHAKYNPTGVTQYNIVPGLIGVVLTMTMAMITAVAVTRERERGTMERLLATPVQPIEVMVGKVVPYIIVGYIQLLLILLFAHFLFDVPVNGSIILLLVSALPFIASNLAMGLLFSAIARSQLQAIQMSTFFFLPSILLSGFMFPFRGMPVWAQWIGQLLPLTHFLRITRGIILKGNGWVEVWPSFWPILLFLLVVMLIGVKRYNRTLD